MIADNFAPDAWAGCFALMSAGARGSSMLSKLGLGASLLYLRGWREVGSRLFVI